MPVLRDEEEFVRLVKQVLDASIMEIDRETLRRIHDMRTALLFQTGNTSCRPTRERKND